MRRRSPNKLWCKAIAVVWITTMLHLLPRSCIGFSLRRGHVVVRSIRTSSRSVVQRSRVMPPVMKCATNRLQSRLFMSSDSDRSRSAATSNNNNNNIHSVGIVGGGLAGLSTAYHLLQKRPSIDIRIMDVAPPGEGGASAVAGG